jgi:hypothetical protein
MMDDIRTVSGKLELNNFGAPRAAAKTELPLDGATITKPGRLQQVSYLYFRIIRACSLIHPAGAGSSTYAWLHWLHEGRNRRHRRAH